MNDKKRENFRKTTKKFIISEIILLIFAIFLLISVIYNANYITIVDNFVFYLCSFVRNSITNNIFLFITFLGETELIMVLLILTLFFPERKDLFYLYPLTIFSAVLNFIIKNFVHRARPINQFALNLIIEYPFPTSFSFPSGHSQTSLVVYFALFYICLKNAKNPRVKNCLSIGIIIPILIMISRVILGVHFFSDVLMGAILGTMIINCFVYLQKNQNKNLLKI